MTHPTQSQRPIAESGRADNSDDETTDVMEPTSSQRAAEPVDAAGRSLDAGRRAPSDGKLAPSHLADDPVVALWGTDLVEGYRGQWRELQLRFVNDPHSATGEAAGLVEEAVQSRTDADYRTGTDAGRLAVGRQR